MNFVQMLAAAMTSYLFIPASMLNWWFVAALTLLLNLSPLLYIPSMISNLK
jgi:hypothetical protein